MAVSKISDVLVFLSSMRQELVKIVWASRRETWMTTVLVFVFAVIAALYFAFVDNVVVRLLNPLIGG